MANRNLLLSSLVIILLLGAGCSSDGVSSATEKKYIDQAKADFESAEHDMYFTDYSDRKITAAKLFDHAAMPKGDAIWAVEMDFVATENATGKEKQGKAMLEYMRINSKTGDEKEFTQKEDLWFFFVGFTKKDIEAHRMAVKGSINTARATKGM